MIFDKSKNVSEYFLTVNFERGRGDRKELSLKNERFWEDDTAMFKSDHPFHQFKLT